MNLLGFDMKNQLWLTPFTSMQWWTHLTCCPKGYNIMALLHYSSQSLNIHAHHILASWNLYARNHDTIHQAIEASATKSNSMHCWWLYRFCVVPLLSLQLLWKTWKGLHSTHITLLINKCAGGSTRPVLIIARQSVGGLSCSPVHTLPESWELRR